MLLFSLLFVTGILYSSVLEWLLHRYVMHRPVGSFRYPFRTHTLVHHRTFKADHTYHLIHEEDREIIPMAWWNGPVLVLISSLPAAVAGFIMGSWIPWLAITASVACYYGAYEYMHWCMHVPKTKRRVVERSGIFFRLNGHHLLHHRYMGKNFNVVLPFADLVFGTLLLRAKVHFKQASGPSVPNVQPREARS